MTDIEIKKSKTERFFEIVPPLLSWLMLSSPIWLGIIAPTVVAVMLTFLCIYWVYLAFVHTIGAVLGYRKYKEETTTDWQKKLDELDFEKLPEKSTLPPTLKDLKHLILIPTVNESLEVLDQTFRSISEQNYRHMENIIIVVPCEERGKDTVRESIEIIKKRYTNIKEILFYVHPQGLPGELVGGGAPNRTWGAKHALEELKRRNENLRNIVFTTFDADTNIHPQFMARLTHAYLTSDKRDNHFYSTAVFLFNNNIWDVHTLMRLEANSITLGVLSFWSIHNETQETFSCYSVSLDTLIAADFWDVGLIDDTVFYWRAFFARKGHFKPKIFYTPNSSDAVHAETFVKAHKSLYSQLLRWGWGSVTTPMALTGFVKEKDIPLMAKLLWVGNKAERHLIFRTLVFLITFGFALLTFVNEQVKQTTIAYSLPDAMSFILSIGMIFIIPNAIIRMKLMPKMPENWPLWKKAFAIIESPLVIINLLTFSFIPFLEAETKMMLGKRYKSLHFTPKVRR